MRALFMFFVTVAIAMLPETLSRACNLPFEPTLQSAQAKAQKRNCPVLLLFTGLDWSPRSIVLDKRLLEHAIIEGLIERTYVPVLVDFPQRVKLSAEAQETNRALAERFGVTHFPTLVALSGDGQEIGRLAFHDETVPSLKAILEDWTKAHAQASTPVAK